MNINTSSCYHILITTWYPADECHHVILLSYPDNFISWWHHILITTLRRTGQHFLDYFDHLQTDQQKSYINALIKCIEGVHVILICWKYYENFAALLVILFLKQREVRRRGCVISWQLAQRLQESQTQWMFYVLYILKHTDDCSPQKSTWQHKILSCLATN